jgi:putative tryptophan/tyrosine transport system substrate-binding protein
MRRREFIALLGAGAVCPLAAGAAPARSDGARRIGVLVGLAEDDANMVARLAALRQGLARRGWSEDRNIRIDCRYAPGGANAQELAKQLVATEPDVILAHTVNMASALQRESRTIPIVFVSLADPIGAGFIASLSRPGGNMTGLTTFEASIAGKWLSMLKEVAPRMSRVAFVANPDIETYEFYLRAVQGPAMALTVELVPLPVRNVTDINDAIAGFAGGEDCGLIVPPDVYTVSNAELIIRLAAQHRLPAIYAFGYLVSAGGLMSYGTDRVEEMRQAASYVDRILRGDKPADLPVQAPTRFETAVNLKTAKLLGLAVPPGLLLAADEVIE